MRSGAIKIDADLAATAVRVRAALPCSVQLPAGTGKTQIIAAVGTLAADAGERVLVLTHTNAGVDALRRRLRQFGAPAAQVRVETIASWAHSLVRHYPQLAEVRVPEIPRGCDSETYYQGALLVATSTAIRGVLRASYRFAVVDEYQDCGASQHALVSAVSETVPVAVFGDPLQSIFDFGGNVPVDWDDVTTSWPDLEVPVQPWRWQGYNEELGQWLIAVRAELLAGRPIVLPDDGPLTWMEASPQNQATACFRQPWQEGPVVAIGNLPYDCEPLASRLRGSYGLMEELEGKRMLALAAAVDKADPSATAVATAEFGRCCVSKVAASLDLPVLKKLREGKTVTHLTRPGADPALAELSLLLDEPTPKQVGKALRAIASIPGVHMYGYEAWHTVTRALALAESGGTSVEVAVRQLRNQIRVTGRRHSERVVSRPVLIKGLEYDHAVVLDGDVHKAQSLYVALTRSRKSLTVLSKTRTIQPVTRSKRPR
jgi:hypothetical protein